MEDTIPIPAVGPLVWIAGNAVILFQVGMAVHVIRTGRPYWWLWLILGFPIIGSLAYLYFEVLPERRLPSFQEIVWKLKGSAGRIQMLGEELEEVDTMNNRVRLAQELSLAKRYDAAATVLEEGMSAAHRDDAYVLYAYAEALINGGKFQQAAEVVGRMNLKDAKELGSRKELQMARICEGLGKAQEAEERYQALMPMYVGEAVRGYYAQFLVKANRVPEARELWTDIKRKYRKSGKIWRKSEKPWYLAAKEGLSATKAG